MSVEEMPAGLRRLLFIFGTVCVSLITLYQWQGRSGPDHLFDFYPLYNGARALLESGDAYQIAQDGADPRGVARVGNAYPVHAVLLLGMPFAGLTPTAAAVAWTAVLGLSWILAVWWARESPYWFLWAPMLLALLLQQPAAAVGVAAIVAMGALRRGSPLPFALALVVLTMKPQQSLLLALAFAWWGRRWWRQVVTVLGIVGIASFVVQPDWLARWLDQIAVRSVAVPTVWIWPALALPAAILFWRGWRESAVAVASTAIGPWPTVGGWYSAAAWPVGAGGSRAAAMALVGVVAVGATLATNESAVFIVVSSIGFSILALVAPLVPPTDAAVDRPDDSGDEEPHG